MATRNEINANFYQIVDADSDGNILDIKPEFLGTVIHQAAGEEQDVQFNDNGQFGADEGLKYNKSTQTLIAQNLSGDGFSVTNIQGENVVGAVATATKATSAESVDGWIKVPFTFSDASPKLVAIIPAGSVVASVDIVILTQFSDTSATLSAGTVANPQELVSTTDVYPASVGTFSTVPGKLYVSETHVVLTITPGTSISGNGMLIIKF